MHLKGVLIYFHKLRYFYSRNSNPDLQKKFQTPCLWIRRHYLDLLIYTGVGEWEVVLITK